MQKFIRNPLAIIAAVVLVAIIALVAYVLRPTVAPSGEIAAVPIEIATQIPALTDSPTATVEDEDIGGQRVFEIQQSSSQVSFTIDEILRGVDTTVVGSTNQVAAQLLIDFEDPSASQIGLVQVNARTLATDIENRNRAIRNQILDVDEYEFISFEATALQGLPESIEIGQSYSITILGDLTIRDITNVVSFDASITIESDEQISGQAETVIQRSDYDLTIPQVLSVAGVSEDVIVAIEFVATAQ